MIDVIPVPEPNPIPITVLVKNLEAEDFKETVLVDIVMTFVAVTEKDYRRD